VPTPWRGTAHGGPSAPRGCPAPPPTQDEHDQR
jgi:hypothetical protein